VGRPSGSKTRERGIAGNLRQELERRIEGGQCAYCRAPARPDSPLTREHVIPRARGGRRKDVRIIVPACARCNHTRGCADLIPFLLARPRRISSFLDYLSSLPPESVREIDLRIFAELYTTIAILVECTAYGGEWRAELERLCSGRSLHRRRYAARRAVGAVAERVASNRDRSTLAHGPSCLVPFPVTDVLPLQIEEPLGRMTSRVLGLLALVWEISAEAVESELVRELNGTAVRGERVSTGRGWDAAEDAVDESILELDGWTARPKRKRLRVDRRHGRSTRGQRVPAPARGRAA
jgi:hypothetical protein